MRTVLIILLSIGLSNGLKAQSMKPSLLKDSVDVINYAKKHSERFNYAPNATFRVSYNKNNNKWTYKSATTRSSYEGDCKYTNGCTIYRCVTIQVNAMSGKYTIMKDSTKVFPNYE
ncbi:MAG TPA: hypothetical protein VD905_08845 [Flavobacteriales bacterium]|nr:hypothetical protein [Flavobacteriales bacterium]